MRAARRTPILRSACAGRSVRRCAWRRASSGAVATCPVMSRLHSSARQPGSSRPRRTRATPSCARSRTSAARCARRSPPRPNNRGAFRDYPLGMWASIVAFCGFYVAGSGQQLTNDATQVVLMREGTRTVLSMQNDYKGPPEAFAMVVPVPVVLHEGDVKTLQKDVFEHTDALGAPRLVEYWEQDPCPSPYRIDPTST